MTKTIDLFISMILETSNPRGTCIPVPNLKRKGRETFPLQIFEVTNPESNLLYLKKLNNA